MGYRVREIIPGIEHEDLVKMLKDLERGGAHLRKLIKDQIRENEKKHEVFCATCLSEIDPGNPNTYTLIFGPEDFRKKATFCAIDCLEYFIKNLKSIRKRAEKRG